MNFCKKVKDILGKQSKIKYFICYSLVFAISFVMVYITFEQRNVSFIQHPDGFQQYYPKLIYIDRYIKKVLFNFLQGNFEIPQFDLNIGLGEDIYSIMGAWIMDLPFSLFSQFFKESQFELFYAFNIVIKLYLAGLSFSYVCLKWGKEQRDVLIGAMCYIFSGYLMRIAPMHPAYIYPFIFFPLVIYGVEKIMKGEKPYIFIFSFWSIMIRGYYFTYIISVLVFIYGITRYFFMYKGEKIKKFFQVFGKAVGYYFLAFLMSMITLLPTIAAFFTSTREGASGTQFNNILYSIEHYKSMVKGLIMPPGDFDYLGFVSVTLLFLFLQFFKKDKESKFLKLLIIENLLIFCFPLGGRLMNGFEYPSNRWSFAFVLLACYCFSCGFHKLLLIEKRQWMGIGIGSFIYNIAFLWGVEYIGRRSLVPLLIFDLFVGCVIVSNFIRSQRGVHCIKVVMTILVFVNLFVNGKYTFAEGYGNLAVEYSTKGTVDHLIAQTTNEFDFKDYDNTIYRVNSTNITNDNFSIVEDVSTPSIYYSVINSSFSDFLGEVNCLRAASNFWISGVDNRAQLESLLGVKYYITTDQTQQYLPYGVEKVKELSEGYSLYQNPYALPLIYSYEKYMPIGEFEELNAIEKQSAMLSAAVVEDRENIPQFSGEKKPETEFSIIDSQGIVQKNNKIIVDSVDNYLELEFSREEGTELYVAFQGLDITNSGNAAIDVFINYTTVAKKIAATAKDYTWHYDNEYPWINLGTTGKKGDNIRISFSAPGEYSLEGIQIYQNELSLLGEQTKDYGEDINNISVATNKISCNADLKGTRIVNISVPYSEGWKAYVDGSEADIFKVNHLSMGIELEEGQHEIVLQYQTPFLKLSIILTIIGWGIFGALYIVQRICENKNKIIM